MQEKHLTYICTHVQPFSLEEQNECTTLCTCLDTADPFAKLAPSMVKSQATKRNMMLQKITRIILLYHSVYTKLNQS